MSHSILKELDRDQDYGSDPTEIRETDTYAEEYVHKFVNKWDELIDWDKRAEAEGNFFIELLRAQGANKILDVACGTGYHSVQLLEAGFEVTSVDGSPTMLARAFENAKKRGHILRTVHADWRYLNKSVHDLYDAVICLGNSFTHIHNENDRRKSLAEYYATLRHDGILVLDHRNYDAILDEGAKPMRNYYYGSEKVTATPEFVDDSLARFCYTFDDGDSYHLNMFPLRQQYVNDLMMDVGFQKITTYGDFQEDYKDNEHEPDFFVHVASKKYEEESEK